MSSTKTSIVSDWTADREETLLSLTNELSKAAEVNRDQMITYSYFYKAATFLSIVCTFISLAIVYVLPDEDTKDIYNVSERGLNIMIMAYLIAFDPSGKSAKFERSASDLSKIRNKIFEQLSYSKASRKDFERFLSEIRTKIDISYERTSTHQPILQAIVS